MKKQPEVTERTRQKLADAFLALIQEKPISKISVSELTRRAGYNRSTFYEYFYDTEDMLAYVEGRVLDHLKQTLLTSLPEAHSPESTFQMVFQTMNEEIYLLIGPNGDSTFLPRVKAELLPLIESYFPLPKDIPDFDYLMCFANSALFGLSQHWHEKGKDLSTKEMGKLMQELVLRGLCSRIPPQPELP